MIFVISVENLDFSPKSDFSAIWDYDGTDPNRLPTAPVTINAKAPQKVTRREPLKTGEPAAREANAPSTAKHNSVAALTE